MQIDKLIKVCYNNKKEGNFLRAKIDSQKYINDFRWSLEIDKNGKMGLWNTDDNLEGYKLF